MRVICEPYGTLSSFTAHKLHYLNSLRTPMLYCNPNTRFWIAPSFDKNETVVVFDLHCGNSGQIRGARLKPQQKKVTRTHVEEWVTAPDFQISIKDDLEDYNFYYWCSATLHHTVTQETRVCGAGQHHRRVAICVAPPSVQEGEVSYVYCCM